MSFTRCAVHKAKQLAVSDALGLTRQLHSSSTDLAQATVKPALRLRSQNAPRLQPQSALRLRPQNAPPPKAAATTPRKSADTVTKTSCAKKDNQPTYFGVKQAEGELKEQFTALLDYVAPRVGLKREVKDGKQIRQSAWSTLLQHAESKEDVEKVVDLMPQWAASKNPFGSDVATWLLKRCYDYKCPELAFRVLNDPIKYGISVPSLDAATQLVATSVRRSVTKDASTLEHIGTLTAVMEHQQLPPLGSTFVSSIVTIRALVDPAMKTSASQRIARDLLLSLVGHIKSGKHDQLIPATDPVGFWALHSALPAIQKWTTAADNHCRGQGRVIFDFREKLGLLAENEERPEYFKAPTPRAKAAQSDASQAS